nr:hypothetical protein [Caldimonas sp.]
MKATSTCRIAASERTSSANTVAPRALELAGDAVADDLEDGLGERDVGERAAIHRREQAEPFAVAVAQRIRRVRIHSLGGEQAGRLELVGEAARDVAELGARDLLARRAGEAVLERREQPAVEDRRDRAHAGPGLVGEDGDEAGSGAEARRHLAQQVGEERRPGGLRGRQRDAVQGARVRIPAGRPGGRHGGSVGSASAWRTVRARLLPCGFVADTRRLRAVVRIARTP